ncbi:MULTISPECIES: aldehyde dehydrogenase family protein [unclassified Microbacterium]|uniref:aldehyde dehydrogenase family protein n=1 Tax=unclassified Microbacterium TaxID=2609290 RepID=UPI0004937CF2|nr:MULTISPECIES: aldehyde dehydrogenase family protein [unclassified Microbacterium]
MTHAVVNPATEDVITTIELANAGEVDRAVERAQPALRAWNDMGPSGRARALHRLARTIEDHVDELARIECLNTGRPLADGVADARHVQSVIEYYANAPERMSGEQIPVDGGMTLTFREPLGVIGIIVPWNFPLMITAWGAIPALAAGNAVILKPALLTPLSAQRLEELFVEAGLPQGLFQVIVGSGGEIGERIATHPGIAKIVFTGSTEVGARVASLAAPLMKKVTLELGGKSANLIFADADIAKAAKAATSVFHNAGQDCCARARIYVERPAYDEFLREYERAIQSLRIGPPDLPGGADVGPLISRRHLEHVSAFVDGSDEVLIQAARPEGPGFWFPPTVISPASRDARIMREEVFGPVATVVPFDHEDHVVREANDSPFGLAGTVWTSNLARGVRVSRAIEAGVISVNSNSAVRYSTPFGGYKMSGLGRELGPDAPFEFTQTKSVFFAAD